MAEEAIFRLTLAVILGTLAAIIYSLRYMVLVERRMMNIEAHVERLAKAILKEELTIERKISKKKRRK